MALHPENDETLAMGAAPATPRPAANPQRFAPGTLLASRYRIVSRLGKGGMGEVFRAEDIMLGQPVALKFLPEHASRNVNLLTRFYDEVRIARQISHANICRVYDIGEIDGQPYLSMEYIDGEDLASLLRRIGRLPGDKAAEFARKMCAGVAAAHAQGVLHRDIKPGNIMIDGRGEPRITDFGLAAVAAGIESAEIRNGTPAYMAPEQLDGREVSIQSDLYALGLVFHEMFTGKAAHDAENVAELTKLRKEMRVTSTSTLVKDLDPAVERAIQACLEPDPKLRPKSALDLARMLPGGDPLAAALAAGQTPSPELVAASGSTGALQPKIALAVLVATLVGLTVTALLQPVIQATSKLPLQNSPEVLTAKARETLRNLGYTAPIADSAAGFIGNTAQIAYFKPKISRREQWDDILSKHPTWAQFWYRTSPSSLQPLVMNGGGVVSLVSPEMNLPGMTSLILGLDGELVQFSAVPPRISDGPRPDVSSVEWAKLFSAARLDPTKFEAIAPRSVPPTATDTRIAWSGFQPTTYAEPLEIPIRVEAASFEGKPVFFKVIYPWEEESREGTPAPLSTLRRLANLIFLVLLVSLLIAAIVLARYHWKAGSGDVKGAVRGAGYVSVLGFLSTLLGAHLGNLDFEVIVVPRFIAMALFNFGAFWVFYMALEPRVRKSWPQVLVTWSRILQKRWTDPMVGRDALFGTAVGTLFFLTSSGIGEWMARRTNLAPSGNFQLQNLAGLNRILSQLAGNAETGIFLMILLLMLLFFLRVILRKQWLAATTFVLITSFLQAQQNSVPLYLSWPFTAVIYSIVVFTMMRLGIFASMILVFVGNSIAGMAFTTDYTAWYGTSSWLILATNAAIALWGYRVSVAGQSLLDEKKA